MALFRKCVNNGVNIATSTMFRTNCVDKKKHPIKKEKVKNAKREILDKDYNESFSIDESVLDRMRENVGRYPAETGGMIGSTSDTKIVDLFYFDAESACTSGTFYYNIEKTSEVNNGWKNNGWKPTGFTHSHPYGMTVPSFHDVATAKLHMDFWHNDFFTMPIVQADRHGLYDLFFYVAYREETSVKVKLEVVIHATSKGYEYDYECMWEREYNNYDLDIENGVKSKNDDSREDITNINEKLFEKISIPDTVRDKVIVCIGGGGSRGFLADMARHGFRKFVIFDGDTVSESNIATQQVYVSDIGKKKVEVIKNEILNINPQAEVVAIDKYLDENISDKEFIDCLHYFKVRTNKDYLLLGCTDSFDAQSRTAYLALKYGTMYEAAMMYKNGAGAELIFTYPGVTPCCPRCLLRKRFEDYEKGYKNDVDSSGCTYFATEVMNAYKGYIALMMLMYHDAPGYEYNDLLDRVKNRNFVWIRLSPNIRDILGINLFDKVFESTEKYTFMGENLWIPQVPDNEENGTDKCVMCGGTGNLQDSRKKWKDTRNEAYRYKRMCG